MVGYKPLEANKANWGEPPRTVFLAASGAAGPVGQRGAQLGPRDQARRRLRHHGDQRYLSGGDGKRLMVMTQGNGIQELIRC